MASSYTGLVKLDGGVIMTRNAHDFESDILTLKCKQVFVLLRIFWCLKKTLISSSRAYFSKFLIFNSVN